MTVPVNSAVFTFCDHVPQCKMAGSTGYDGEKYAVKSCKSECEMKLFLLPEAEQHSQQSVRPKSGNKNGGKIKAYRTLTSEIIKVSVQQAFFSFCVVRPSDPTSYSSVKVYRSVHHVHRLTCVVTCVKNLFNKFKSFQTFSLQA